MVKEVQKRGKHLFICEECDYAYEQKEWAEKCEQWCRTYHNCNMEIIQHGVPLEQTNNAG